MDDIKAISISLASYIKKKRQEQNLTQEQLANLSKIDYKHIQNLESSKRVNDPKLSTLRKLAKALNVPVSEIVDHLSFL